MKLDQIDWKTLSRAQARMLVPAASRVEQRAAQAVNRDDGPDVDAEWRKAFDLWEDLRVYAITGENPRA